MNRFFPQTIDCEKPKNVKSVNQKIREKTYQYIQAAIQKERNIHPDSLLNLARDYIEIQTSFNAVFSEMKGKTGIFVSEKKALQRLIRLAQHLSRPDECIR